jgi:hypothetical protein
MTEPVQTALSPQKIHSIAAVDFFVMFDLFTSTGALPNRMLSRIAP